MKRNKDKNLTAYIHAPYQKCIQFLKNERKRLKLRKRGSFITSTWISLAIRPVLEKDRIKALFAAPLMTAAIASGSIGLADSQTAFESWDITQPVDNILTYEITPPQREYNPHNLLPVTNLLGISQYYHPGHPGIDLRAGLSTNVVSINKGQVKHIEYSGIGYGNRVIVQHENGLKSMYAHMGHIDARLGEYVSAGELLGQVGMTGMTTGPHVHFEIYDQDQAINPLPQLQPAIEAYYSQFHTQEN